MILFWSLFSIDVIITIVVIYFFIFGLADGSVTLDNVSFWFFILIFILADIFSSFVILNYDLFTSKIILSFVAIPGILIGSILVYVAKKKWK